MLAQLNAVFSRMESPLVLKLYLDHRQVRFTEADPCVEVYRQDGTYSGLAFHGVPGGHESAGIPVLYHVPGSCNCSPENGLFK